MCAMLPIKSSSQSMSDLIHSSKVSKYAEIDITVHDTERHKYAAIPSAKANSGGLIFGHRALKALLDEGEVYHRSSMRVK